MPDRRESGAQAYTPPWKRLGLRDLGEYIDFRLAENEIPTHRLDYPHGP